MENERSDQRDRPALGVPEAMSAYRRALVRHLRQEKSLRTYKSMVTEHMGKLTETSSALKGAQSDLDAAICRESDVE